MASPSTARVRRGGSRRPAAAILCLILVLAPAPGQPAVILKKAGASGGDVAQALARAMNGASAPRVLELSGDALADSARVARETRGESTLFVIGHEATELVGDVRGPAIVSLGVPNPARVRTAGTYVSMYPRLERVFELLKGPLKARAAGLLFMPTRNREVAVTFLKAGEAAGVNVVPIPVSSDGDLVRELKGALPRVDVLVLLVDPIIFNQQNLGFVVGEARQARKPTLGFLEELTSFGVVMAMEAPAAAKATAALAASKEPVVLGKKRVEVEAAVLTVSKKDAEAIGLNAEALGAQKVR